MWKQAYIVLGVLLTLGCADEPQNNHYESGCSEAPSDSGGYSNDNSGGGSGGGNPTGGDTGTADTQFPRIVKLDVGPSKPITLDNIDVDGAYLLVDTSGEILLNSIHVTAHETSDTVYNSDGSGTVSASNDTGVAWIYGYANGSHNANLPSANQYRLVIKLNKNVSATTIANTSAFIYRPTVSGTTDGIYLQASTSIFPTGAMNDGAATGYTGGGSSGMSGQVGHVNNALVLELPAVSAVSQGDVIVIQNLEFDGNYYSLHISVPAAINNLSEGGVSTATTEPALNALTATIYRHIYLDSNSVGLYGDVGGFQTGTLISTDNAIQDPAVVLAYDETIETHSSSYMVGSDDDWNTDDVAYFLTYTTVTGTNNSQLSIKLDARNSIVSPVTESDSRYVGHNANLTVVAVDTSGNASTISINLRKGHKADITSAVGSTNDADLAVLNIIYGTAL